MSNISPLIKLMLDVSSKVSRFLSRDYYELKSLQSSRKSNQMFVEKSLDKIKGILLGELERIRPEFGIVCTGFNKESTSPNQEKWVITVMDGVQNFTHSIPLFGISISIAEMKNSKEEITSCLMVFPILDEVYFAEKGKGAWYTGSMGKYSGTHRLRVSERKENLMVFGVENADRNIYYNREFGCNILASAYVASGKLDFARVRSKDIEAGILLVREAGGVITEGSDFVDLSSSSVKDITK
ncbi:MAG: hypothetical protein K0T99_01180 [Alphaproteobacteria bacterium]|nr:hypothetical protein [Alphaproteobacteria bacterium]